MARFVHLAPEPLAKRIRRSGIKPTHVADWTEHWGLTGVDRMVWCFPVTANYTLSHQWLRELKRFGVRTIVAVTFKIPDDETVFVRHYNQPPGRVTAAGAVAAILAHQDGLGWEVMVPRRIAPGEIVSIRTVAQKLGWRTVPGTGRPLLCDCDACIPRGVVKATRRRGQFAQAIEARIAERRRKDREAAERD